MNYREQDKNNMSTLNINMKDTRRFLDIPYEEHIIPFPNFASVLLQHARVFPAKPVFVSDKVSMTYSELLEMSLTLGLPRDKRIHLSFNSLCDDLLILMALLYQGIPFSIDFKKESSIQLADLKNNDLQVNQFEPPYVRLDDEAFILNNEYCFSQYNVMVAAQSVGNAFKLFREGAAYCPHHIHQISDLIFGILAPIYFAKTIHLSKRDGGNIYQYAWNDTINSTLRDNASVFLDPSDEKNIYRLITPFDQALGLGKIIDPAGKTVNLLGFELDESREVPTPRGHCIGTKI